jgi:L,D-transpeptidase catalytic domain
VKNPEIMRPLKSVSTTGLIAMLLIAPVLISGNRPENPEKKMPFFAAPAVALASVPEAIKSTREIIIEEAQTVYEGMNLKRVGLSEKAFTYAWQGYKQLLEAGQIYKKGILTICDFSQSSRRRRMYIVDVENQKLLVQTFVAHGRNSGGEYARRFSNSPESHKSSLGFYITRNTYFGGHGLALNIEGLEKGFNDKADARNIVVHGSRYVGVNHLRNNPFNGRSFGCPAIPAKETKKIIHTIKGGSVFFIYHPTKDYLERSTLLNG